MTTIASHRFNNDLRYRPANHTHQTALTPSYVLDPVREDLNGIELDPCSTPANPCRAERFYAPPQDGLTLPWNAASIFVNPPYGKAREPWALKCEQAGSNGSAVVLLVPSHTDTRLFQQMMASATAAVLVQGRVKFGEFGVIRDNGRQAAASHGSVLFGWNIEFGSCSRLGVVVRHW